MGHSQHFSDIIRIYAIDEHIHIRYAITSNRVDMLRGHIPVANSIRFKASGSSPLQAT